MSDETPLVDTYADAKAALVQASNICQDELLTALKYGDPEDVVEAVAKIAASEAAIATLNMANTLRGCVQ